MEKGYREGPKITGLEGRKDPGTGQKASEEAAEEEGFRGSPPALHGWGMAAAAGITPSSCAPARGFASPEGNVAEVWIHLTVRGEKQPACWDVGEKFLKARGNIHVVRPLLPGSGTEAKEERKKSVSLLLAAAQEPGLSPGGVRPAGSKTDFESKRCN